MARGTRHEPATLAARLRARRLALGLTQPRVAALAGFTINSYRRYEEQGQRPHDPARRAALAQALRTSVDELFGTNGSDCH